MTKLFQYLINNITNLEAWMNQNNMSYSSFNKIIVESIDKVQLLEDFNQALKENFIVRIRFFNHDYDFHLFLSKDNTFDMVIYTEREMSFQKIIYEVIEKLDDIQLCCTSKSNKATFKQYQYICRPITSRVFKEPNIQSLSELISIYRIYD